MYRLETGPIDINEIARSVFSPAAGGVVVFIGTVRDDGTDSLEIEAYEEELRSFDARGQVLSRRRERARLQTRGWRRRRPYCSPSASCTP